MDLAVKTSLTELRRTSLVNHFSDETPCVFDGIASSNVKFESSFLRVLLVRSSSELEIIGRVDFPFRKVVVGFPTDVPRDSKI